MEIKELDVVSINLKNWTRLYLVSFREEEARFMYYHIRPKPHYVEVVWNQRNILEMLLRTWTERDTAVVKEGGPVRVSKNALTSTVYS